MIELAKPTINAGRELTMSLASIRSGSILSLVFSSDPSAEDNGGKYPSDRIAGGDDPKGAGDGKSYEKNCS